MVGGKLFLALVFLSILNFLVFDRQIICYCFYFARMNQSIESKRIDVRDKFQIDRLSSYERKK